MILKQKTPGKFTEYELEKDAIVLKQKQGAERIQTRIKFETLLTDPDHRASAQRGLLYFGIFITLLAIIFSSVASTTHDEVSRIFFVMLTVVSLAAAAVFFHRFRRSRFDVITYFYRNGSFAFNIWRNNPDEASFSDFVSELNQLIKVERESSDRAASEGSSLATEIDRLGTLRDKGLLTEEEFLRAKSSLLDGLDRSGRVMGFHQ